MTQNGTLYIISAPSGAGKSSLIQAYLKYHPLYEAQVSISHTTRNKREAEQEGVHYYFIDKPTFLEMIEKDDFLEHAEVFGNYYGTSKNAILNTLASGVDVFLDIDWQGARQIRNKMPSAKSIFILPPSNQELLRRLKGRGQDSDETIDFRMKQAKKEIEHFDEYDYVIINDDFERALSDLKAILRSEKLKTEYQLQNNKSLFTKLLSTEI
ncbi:guanylate kinase [Thorsellia anophelis]|uniref:Guanylate kinase n=1 Tax=Thorsellia anophelis DSM 18579 TaxID=1123402 RepID=A0A1I0E4S7_9GAMM|nr:guanylate kinase [Thorsellia anophelis]SET40130.1 guanylate kinase [Thorsellia anophelis DSM 18579]